MSTDEVNFLSANLQGGCAASNPTPIYIAEVSPPATRGRLVGLYELSWRIGELVGSPKMYRFVEANFDTN